MKMMQWLKAQVRRVMKPASFVPPAGWCPTDEDLAAQRRLCDRRDNLFKASMGGLLAVTAATLVMVATLPVLPSIVFAGMCGVMAGGIGANLYAGRSAEQARFKLAVMQMTKLQREVAAYARDKVVAEAFPEPAAAVFNQVNLPKPLNAVRRRQAKARAAKQARRPK